MIRSEEMSSLVYYFVMIYRLQKVYQERAGQWTEVDDWIKKSKFQAQGNSSDNERLNS